MALHFSKIAIPFYNFNLRINHHYNHLKSTFGSLNENLRLISKGSKKVLFQNGIISLLQGIIPFAIIVCVKELVDRLNGLNNENSQQFYWFLTVLIITALLFLLSGILTELKSYYSEKLSQSVLQRVYKKLHKKHASLDLTNYENPDKQDKTHRAVQEASYRPIKMLNELLTGIKSIASALFLLGLFISIRWYLVLILVVATIPGIFIRLKFSKKFYELKDTHSRKEREMYYYNRILTGFPFAKELKLFGFFSYFKKRFNSVQENLFDEKIALRKSELQWGLFAQFFSIALIFISLAFISYLKINGLISIGTVVLFFFAFQRGYSVLNELFRSVTMLVEDNTFLKDFTDFLKLPSTSEKGTNSKKAFSLKKEISIENVSFKYETSQRYALNHINLTIPAGKTVAFVGANGSGKTTLIKLLCGFYQPENGQIKYDNIDAEALGQTQICENITAVFQDFALYNIPAIENITLGNIQIPFDTERAKNAAKQAGINDLFEKLPNGYDTMLGNLFKGGEELSIGQWQKIAIARAFYRNSTLILMDEPSSALDADSELQIIKSLKKLSQEKTAIIVSHRLSTVKWADLIYFFENGEIVESGTHTDLLALKGKYFSLFMKTNNELDMNEY